VFAPGTRKYSATDAYASSKLAGVTLAKELERRFAASGANELASVRCLSVHPGNVLTGVVRTLPRAVQVAYRIVMGFILLSPAEGARAPVLCAAGAAPARAPRPGPYFGSGGREEAPNPAAHDDAAQQALWAHTLRTLQLDEATLGLMKR
jgi:NAD(P)-dependent dehydrogenase (short-subunit alcohol dehydrogenase family)